MMRKKLLALLVVLALVPILGRPVADAQGAGASGQAAAKASPKPQKSRFIGTWKLVSIEPRNAKGEVVPPAAGTSNRTGYLIYDPAGYMAVSIMRVGRRRNAGAQVTGDEARAAMTSYAAYYGTFTPDEAGGFVTHRLQGSLST